MPHCTARRTRWARPWYDDAKPSSYDLVVVRPPAPGDGFLQQLEPNKQSLNLMRKSDSNVMLLRAVPPHHTYNEETGSY